MSRQGTAIERMSGCYSIRPHLQKGGAVAVGNIEATAIKNILQVLGGEFPGHVFPRALFMRFKDLSLDRRYRAVEGRILLPFAEP